MKLAEMVAPLLPIGSIAGETRVIYTVEDLNKAIQATSLDEIKESDHELIHFQIFKL
jgi:hypothetical protein